MKKDLFVFKIWTVMTFFCAVAIFLFISSYPINAYQPIVTIGKPSLQDISYSPDGRYLATLTDSFIEFLDAETLKPVSKIYTPEFYTDNLKISPDSSLIAVHGRKGIYIFEIASGKTYATIPVFTYTIDFSPDGKYLAYAEKDKDSVFLWDIGQKKVVKELTGDPEPLLPNNNYWYFVSAIAFHPKGKILAVASQRKTIALWNIDTGEIISHLEAMRTSFCEKIEFSNDGNWLVVRDGLIWRYDLSTGKSNYISGTDFWGMAITADSNYILTGDQYAKLRIHDVRTRSYEERSVIDPPKPNCDCGTASTERIAVSPNGKSFATLFNGSRLTIWNTNGFTREKVTFGWMSSWINAVYLPKLNRIITAEIYGNELLFWNATSGELAKVNDYYMGVECIVPSPDGKKVAVNAEWRDHVYDALTGDEIYKFEDRNGHTKIFAFSPSGKYLASNGWKGTYIYDMKDGKLLKWIFNEWLNNPMMFFTPDEKQIIIMPEDDDTKEVRMEYWDIESGELVDKKSYAGPMVRFGKDFMQARANKDETEIYLLNSGKRLSKIPANLAKVWDWGQVLHPSGNIIAFQTPTDNEYLYNFDFYNPWTGNLIATIPNIFSIRFVDDDYMFMIDDKLQLGLYRISDVLGVKPDDGFYGNLLTPFGKIKNELMPNYPNPFNPDTWIPYQLENDADVTIKIYTESGEVIRTLNLGYKKAGKHISKGESAYWDGKNEYGESVSSGIFFYTIQADNYNATKKMIVLK